MGMTQSPDTQQYHTTGTVHYSAEILAGTSARGFALPRMDRIWLAVMVSGILVLITAMGLVTFALQDPDVPAPVYSVGRGRH
jgi:hypothetical protein